MRVAVEVLVGEDVMSPTLGSTRVTNVFPVDGDPLAHAVQVGEMTLAMIDEVRADIDAQLEVTRRDIEAELRGRGAHKAGRRR